MRTCSTGLLGLPVALMREAGLLLVPYVAFVAFVGTRRGDLARRPCRRSSRSTSRGSLGSIGLLMSGIVAPTVLGYAFVIFQAVVVGVFAELQFIGLRRDAGGDRLGHTASINLGNAPPGHSLGGAFRRVGVAVDHLQVRQSPEREERRPVHVAMLAPHPEQRHAMIDLAGLPQPRAGLGAAALLQPPQQLGVIARRIPQPP